MTMTTGTLLHDQAAGCNYAVDLHCTADKHGTLTAYHHHHCRCAIARRRAMHHDKDYRARVLRDGPQLVDATGTRRRLQALAALGYSMREIASHGTVHQNQLKFILNSRERVQATTAATVSALYGRLADQPPTGRYVTKTRNWAAGRGYLPPLWWDDDTIDNPDHQPNLAMMETVPRRGRGHRLSVAGDVDPVVVERLTSGAPVTDARPSDQYAAYAQLRGAGLTRHAASERLRLSSVARMLFATTYDDEHLEASA